MYYRAIYALAWVVGNPLLILIVTIYTIVVVIMIANVSRLMSRDLKLKLHPIYYLRQWTSLIGLRCWQQVYPCP